jgi:serine/threonine-protein kinase
VEETRFGKYSLLERLGGGGMAEVFRARLFGPQGFKKDVALKLILPQFSDEPDFVRMFIHEANLVASLEHANIVRVHEFDQVDGRYYIAMELVDGRDLRTILSQTRELGRRIQIAEALVIVLGVCNGLASAHGEYTPGSEGVVHRDVSPHNIILSKAGEVKITDFGIAKLASTAGFTKTGVVKGKISYMSPEQARGKTVDARSDVFALGCILWELLTGRRLFSGENDAAILDNLLNGDIRVPSRYNEQVPEELDSIALKALQRDLDARYDKASSMARDLERVLAGFVELDRNRLIAELVQSLFAESSDATGMMPAVASDGDQPIEPAGPVAQTLSEQKQPDECEQVFSQKVETEPLSKSKLLVSKKSLLVLSAVMVVVVGIGLIVWTSDSTPIVEPKDPVLPDVIEKPSVIQQVVDEPKLKTGPKPKPEQKSEPKTKPKPRVKQTGRLSINVIPWGHIYWKDKYLGQSPIENVKMPVGKHRLRIVNKNLGISRSYSVVIRSRKTTERLINLEKKIK